MVPKLPCSPIDGNPIVRFGGLRFGVSSMDAWRTARLLPETVKLLLPPRQSRGDSPWLLGGPDCWGVLMPTKLLSASLLFNYIDGLLCSNHGTMDTRFSKALAYFLICKCLVHQRLAGEKLRRLVGGANHKS